MSEEKTSDLKEERKVGQYIIGETLGKGGYSWVKKGVDEKTRVPVALKFMLRANKFGEKKQAQHVRAEIKSLMRINHPNVMKLYAYNLNCQYPEKSGARLTAILLVLEYCPGGELFDILYYTHQLDEVTARTYFIQMMKAIKACHDAGIVHRDIKPQNLLLDQNFQLKLTDFGLSFLGREGVDVKKITMSTSHVGTRGYQAPELLKGIPYQKACDIFSAGVVLFILLTGYPPFEQAIKTDKWFNPLAKMDVDKFWMQHKGSGIENKDCQNLIASMMAYRASNRPSLSKILNHPWVKGSKAKVHSPQELKKVLREKYRNTRSRRRRDKKKMKEMQNSVKKRALRVQVDFKEFPRCPAVSLMEYKPTWMSFITKARHLREAYWLAKNVCNLAFGKQTCTSIETDPWIFTKVINASFYKDIISEYLLQVSIAELEGLEKYSFTFKLIHGDPLGFRRIWARIETLLLTQRSADGKYLLFLDDYMDDGSCIDEFQTENNIGRMIKRVIV